MVRWTGGEGREEEGRKQGKKGTGTSTFCSCRRLCLRLRGDTGASCRAEMRECDKRRLWLEGAPADVGEEEEDRLAQEW